MLPRKIFFTKGVGMHREKLTSFELALRSALIAPYNLVRVSSIYPPGVRRVPVREGVALIPPGSIVHAVMAESATNEPNRLIAASVGIAIPKDKRKKYGYLSEHHSFGETDETAGEYAEDLAATMLASTLGIEFDPEKAWKEREQVYKASRLIIRTHNITQSATGNKRGLWTTVVASAILFDFRI